MWNTGRRGSSHAVLLVPLLSLMPLMHLLVICAPASREWTTVGEGMCEPPEHTLNSYPFITEAESACGRLCDLGLRLGRVT